MCRCGGADVRTSAQVNGRQGRQADLRFQRLGAEGEVADVRPDGVGADVVGGVGTKLKVDYPS